MSLLRLVSEALYELAPLCLCSLQKQMFCNKTQNLLCLMVLAACHAATYKLVTWASYIAAQMLNFLDHKLEIRSSNVGLFWDLTNPHSLIIWHFLIKIADIIKGHFLLQSYWLHCSPKAPRFCCLSFTNSFLNFLQPYIAYLTFKTNSSL